MSDKWKVWHVIATGGPDVNLDTNYFNDFASSLYHWADQRDPPNDFWADDWQWGVPTTFRGEVGCDRGLGEYQWVSNDFIYTPSSKRVYKDYKTCDGEEHYFALVSLVMDHNITREYDLAWLQEGYLPPIKLDDTVFPWAALLVHGIRGPGTVAAGSYVAHTFAGWGFLNTMNIQYPADPADLTFGWPGATALVLEFIDHEQDGHMDEVSVVEIVGTILSDKTIIPCIDWEARKWGWVMEWVGDRYINTGMWIWEDDDRLPLGEPFDVLGWNPIDCNEHTWPERPITYSNYFGT
jgi:hypothetical protein